MGIVGFLKPNEALEGEITRRESGWVKACCGWGALPIDGALPEARPGLGEWVGGYSDLIGVLKQEKQALHKP